MAMQQHIVFMNLPATGHMNPTLPLVTRLVARGCRVSYFVDQSMQSVVEAAGATWFPHRCGSDTEFNARALPESASKKYVPEGTPVEEVQSLPLCGLLCAAERVLPSFLEDLAAMQPPPSAIVYDPFLAHAQVAAHVLGIPAVGMVTLAGPGALATPDVTKAEWDAKPWVAGPARAMFDKYGLDVLASGRHMEFYSNTLNLVTTIDELFQPPRPGRQSQLWGSFPFRCVGVLKDQKVKRIANANLKTESCDAADASLLERMDEASRAGRRSLFISMGTVATGPFWSTSFGAMGADNGLADCTGKELVQHVFRCCFEAVGGNDDCLVVMSAGPHSDALEGLPPVPSNFIVRQAVPQLDVLQRCSAFLTHCGANSLHEALSFGVPMVVVPVFGDQPINCDAAVGSGAALGFRQPLSTVSPDALRSAFSQLMAGGSSFQAAAQGMSQKMLEAGGVDGATDAILGLVDSVTRKASLGGA